VDRGSTAHPPRAREGPEYGSRELSPAKTHHGKRAAYWLRRCQGFRVDSRGARIGTVEDVLYGSELDQPAALLIRTGIFVRRLESISVDEIEAIDPRAQRLSVRFPGETSRTA
jgi:hypothetical protein